MAGEPTLDLSGVHVVIPGWAGSKLRQLRGIGRFYRRLGAEDVIVASADVFAAMGDPEGWPKEGRELAERIARAKPAHLVAHVFSNAGFWTWAAALEALPEDVRGRVRAVIIDSAPGFPERIDPAFYARHSAMAMVPIALASLRRPPALHHPLLTPPIWAFMRFWYHVSPRQIAFAERTLSIVKDTGSWDHLFLYSAADALVPPHFVEAFMHRLRANGRGVEHLRWEEGAHVRHLVTHRAEYFARVASFLAGRVARSAPESADRAPDEP